MDLHPPPPEQTFKTAKCSAAPLVADLSILLGGGFYLLSEVPGPPLRDGEASGWRTPLRGFFDILGGRLQGRVHPHIWKLTVHVIPKVTPTLWSAHSFHTLLLL